MKNQYFGDINDYQKYAILRALSPGGTPSLFVAWWLTPNDERTDGRRIEYLQRPKMWGQFDPEVYQFLAEVVGSGLRDISAVEESGLLPTTGFFSEIVPDDSSGRDAYFQRLTSACSGYDLVFVDPDNGIEVPSVPYGRRNSSKYVYWKELRGLFEGGHTVVVYQHFPRVDRQRFVAETADRIRHEAPGSRVAALGTVSVAFFVIGQLRHSGALDAGVETVVGNWAEKIHVYDCGSDLTSV